MVVTSLFEFSIHQTLYALICCCSQSIPPDEACMQSAFGEAGLSLDTFSFALFHLGFLVSRGFDCDLIMNRWWKELMGEHMAQVS